jgi:hypothetical protein
MEANIQGLGTYQVEVRGESECQSLLEKICGGRRNYRLQPTLVISGDTVRVEVDGATIGRVDDGYAPGYKQQMAKTPYLNAKVWCEAMIVGGDLGLFGVKLDLPPNVLALEIVEGGPTWPDGSRKNPRGRA